MLSILHGLGQVVVQLAAGTPTTTRILLQEEGYCVQMIWWVVQTMRDLANIAQWHSGIITIISSFSLRYVNMAKLTPERCFLSSTLLCLAVYLW